MMPSKQPRPFMFTWMSFATLILTILAVQHIALAQPTDGPFAISEVSGKTGPFLLKLTERSPLSAPAEILKRVHAKPEELGEDYDLSKQTFNVYVPAQPGEDGKYGLLVALVFAGGHGFAPQQFRPVLDQYHCIWIGPSGGGDDRPTMERLGEMLDVAANAKKAWPIDDNRLYASVNAPVTVANGIGLYYPDVFSGVLGSLQLRWFAKLPDLKQPSTIWNLAHMPPPQPENLSMAKTHSRFFFATRDDGENANNVNDVIFKNGYQRSGFKHIKMIRVPHKDMDLWSNYTGDWLEQGIQYLDKSLAEVQAAPQPEPARPSAAKPPQPSTRPAADDPALQAKQSLSLAKSYISAARYDIARQRLQKIVETYPNSAEAKEAKTLLQQIAGK